MNRTKGISRQHLAPLYEGGNNSAAIHKSNPSLKAIFNDLIKCKDDFIDTVYIKNDHSIGALKNVEMYVEVCFRWNGFSKGSSFIIGEVWKFFNA
jgi:hypothetical protein